VSGKKNIMIKILVSFLIFWLLNDMWVCVCVRGLCRCVCVWERGKRSVEKRRDT